MPAYKRILLKLSGEVLAGGAQFGIDADRVHGLAREIAAVAAASVQIGVVVCGLPLRMTLCDPKTILGQMLGHKNESPKKVK